MKRYLILSVLTLTFAAAPARAQTTATFEPISVIDKDGMNTSIEGTFGRSFDKSAWGLGGFWWVMKDWAEAYAGPTWTPKEGVSLGLGLGAEQQGDGKNVRFRYALSGMLEGDSAYVSACVEHNTGLFRNEQEGLWYDVVAVYKGVKATEPYQLQGNVGLRTRRGIGAGPYVEVKIPKWHSRPWVTVLLIDPEHPATRPVHGVFVGWMIEL